MIDIHPNRTMANLGRVPGCPWHCSILSKERVSKNPGAVQSGKATANVGLYRGPRKNWAVLAPEGGPRMSVRAVVRELLRGGFPEASREPGFEVRTSDKERTGGSLRLTWARTGSLRGSDRTAAGTRAYKESIEAMVMLLRRKGYSVKAGLKVDGIPVYFIHGWRPRATKK